MIKALLKPILVVCDFLIFAVMLACWVIFEWADKQIARYKERRQIRKDYR